MDITSGIKVSETSRSTEFATRGLLNEKELAELAKARCNALKAADFMHLIILSRFEEGFLPTCKMEDRKKLVSWLSDFARKGAQWAEDILTFKPCDLWPQIRGKTVWIIGDSVSQVSFPASM